MHTEKKSEKILSFYAKIGENLLKMIIFTPISCWSVDLSKNLFNMLRKFSQLFGESDKIFSDFFSSAVNFWGFHHLMIDIPD